jgi:hypothetical protein
MVEPGPNRVHPTLHGKAWIEARSRTHDLEKRRLNEIVDIARAEPDTREVAPYGQRVPIEELADTPGSDRYVEDRGVGFHVAGVAERSGTSLRFAWSFRENVDYLQCLDGLPFEGGTVATLDIRVRTAALFDDPDDTNDPPSRFDSFASADANADGTLMLDELETVTFPDDPDHPTLGARLYRKVVPELPFVPGAPPCIPVFSGK